MYAHLQDNLQQLAPDIRKNLRCLLHNGERVELVISDAYCTRHNQADMGTLVLTDQGIMFVSDMLNCPFRRVTNDHLRLWVSYSEIINVSVAKDCRVVVDTPDHKLDILLGPNNLPKFVLQKVETLMPHN